MLGPEGADGLPVLGPLPDPNPLQHSSAILCSWLRGVTEPHWGPSWLPTGPDSPEFPSLPVPARSWGSLWRWELPN